MERVSRLIICAVTASLLVSSSTAVAKDVAEDKTLTVCTNLKTGVQSISKTGRCNDRIHETRTWYKPGSAPSGTPGSKLIEITSCASKNASTQIIRTRERCNPTTQVTEQWQRFLGQPLAPSITSVVMGLSGSATLNINPPAADGGARISAYVVTSTPGGVTATYLPAAIRSAKILGLTPGITHSFKVVATNSQGSSPASAASVPALAPTVPGTPVITRVVSTGTNTALLSFTAPLDNGGLPITSFVATSRPGGMQTTLLQSSSGTFNISNLAHSTNYTFTVTAHNAAGASPSSAVSSSIATAVPPPPPPPMPAFTLSASTETRTVNTLATGFTVTSTGGPATFSISPAAPAGMTFNTVTGAFSGTPTAAAAAVNYTVAASNETGSATRVFSFTVSPRVFALGEIGPGGGIVFFVADGNFTQVGATGTMCTTNCKYLEVAPKTWFGGTADPKITFSPNFNAIPAPGAFLRTIGGGYQNSVAVVNLYGDVDTHANGAARRYRGNDQTDWFLPSQNELNQLCVYFSNAATRAENISETWAGGGLCNGSAITGRGGIGGFSTGLYHASSVLEAAQANSYQQDLANGNVPYIRDIRRDAVSNVRPIRAFG